MKKLFFAVAAMAAMLTSCSKDDGITEVTPQNSMVTFTVNAPELATRANEGQGLQAKNLKWVIYDLSEAEGQNQISGETTFPENSLTTTVEVSLVEGREYEAIFFAYADNSPYTFNATAQTMSIDASGLKANSEAYDAFFKYVEPFEIETEAYNVDVEMKRPFAQLNVATSDMQTDAGKMIDAATTGVKVEAYKTLDFKTGAVADKELITYALDQKMSGHIVAGQDSYDWLTMNYILVNERETVNVEFSFTDEKGDESTGVYTRNYTAVPVERNYRTNIVGTILTSKTDFNVEIVPGFVEPNIDWNVDEVYEVTVENGDLQTALNSLGTGEYNKPGTYIFKLTEDMTGVTRAAGTASIIVEQKEDYNIIIDGCGLKFDGTFNIYGGSRSSGTETLIFRNINFVHADGNIDFIWSDDGDDSQKRYAHNVTVENCTFTGNATGTVVGMRLRQVYNLNIVNCVSGEGMFSLAQISSSQKDLFIDNVTINNNKEGINLLSSFARTTIKNSNISANVYGVRADGTCTDATLTIENTNIDANYPVVVRKMTGKLGVVFNGNNTLNAGQKYDVVFTNGAYNSLVEPTGEWSITGADNFSVYPREVVISTADELKAFSAAVNAGDNYKNKVVTLANNIDLAGAEWTPIGGSDRYENNFAGTFDGMGYTVRNFTVNGEYAGFFGTISGGATIKNLTIDNATLSGPHYAGGIVAWAEAGATSLTIENCHVKNSTITLAAEKVNGEWDNGDKAGGIIGFSHVNQIIGCSVENTTITAYRDCGGIVGYTESGVIKDNKVKSGVKLISDASQHYKTAFTTIADFNFGDIIGRRAGTPAESGNVGSVTMEGDIFNDSFLSNGNLYVMNINGFKAFRDDVNAGNTYAGKSVTLMTNIDLNNDEWTPIGTSSNNFKGTFNGNGHTVSNLVVNGGSGSDKGLFGYTTDGEIKNLTVNNAKVSGRLNVAVVAGTPYTSKYTNINVTGHVEVNGFAYVGGVGGKNAYANWDNIKVEVDNTSYVKANSVENGSAYRTYVGGVVGFNGEGGHKFSNITSNIDVIGSTIDVGGLFGIAHYGNSFENCSSSGKVEITNAGDVEDADQIGGIAGVWHNGGEDVTFTNCSYTGKLSVNVEGVDLSDNTIVGSAYSSTGTGKLFINGNEFVPKSESQKALEAAIAKAANGKPVTLTENVVATQTIVIPAGKTITIDLNGKTITGTMHKNVGPVIKNNGTLTITSGTISSTANNGGSAITNSGTLKVENATLNGAPNADGSWPSYTVNNTGAMTVKDTKITSCHGAVASYNDGAIVTLNNSEIAMAGIPGFTNHGIYTYNNGKVVVNGGTYKNNATDQASTGGSVINGAVEVNAGTFSGRIENYSGTPVLKGGTYSVNPNVKFIATGFKVVDNGNGTWSVVAK